MVSFLRENGVWLGPMLSGVSLLVAAIAAWATYFFYHRRTVQTAWIDSYRLLYAEFWKDEGIATVRNLITNDVEYTEAEKILRNRLDTKSNNLSVDQNKVIESIDRFCALLIRIKFFESLRLTRKQRALWNETYRDFWIAQIRKREALRNYMYEYWPGLRSILTE